jgi:hypothetical protein
MTDKLTDKQLSTQIRRLVKTAVSYRAAEEQIYAHCLEVYGYTPSDCDCDTLLDSVFGYNSMNSYVSPEEFHEHMTEAISYLKKGQTR